jgi:glycosyltransferase involved in cell wall biosynthesis
MTALSSSENAVALFTLKGYLGISTPNLNAITFLADRGYAVDVYGPPQMAKFLLPDLSTRGVSFIELENRLMRGFILRDIEHILTHVRPKRKYRFVIGEEPEGLLRASLFASVWRVPYVYYSLDIAECNQMSGWRERLKKQIESFLSRRAVLTIAMDEARAQILSEINGIPRERVTAVFNSARGATRPEKDTWLRKKFGIRDDAVVVVAVGSLMPFTSIDKIVASVSSWDSRFVLVVHGWFVEPTFESRVRALAAQFPGRVFFSTDLLEGDTKYRIFQSADVGLVFYEPLTESSMMRLTASECSPGLSMTMVRNLSFVGGSAGKLFDFMRTGVPIVAGDLPGMRDLVEGNRCGLVVDAPSQIGDALIRILATHAEFSERALAAFPRYEFDRFFAPALDRILSACPVRESSQLE